MMIKLTPFGGLTPRTGNRLLPNEGATVAANLKLQSGELRPLRNIGLLYSPATPKNALQLSIFNARNGTTNEDWFTWPIDVNCVRVPLATDVESRFCWTGDGPPKMATYTNAVSGAGFNYPLLANELSLGIPTPQTAPVVKGPAATVTMTIASPGVISWAGHHFAAGATVVFTTTGALPTGLTAGTTYYVIAAGLTDGVSFQVSATSGGAAINTSGTQSGVHTGTATVPFGTGSAVTRFYRYTFFSALGEESSPSPISAEITGKVDGTWALSALDEVPANSGVGTATATRFTDTALKHWLRVGDEVYFGSAPTTARTVTAIFSATAFDVTGASIAAETSWSRKTPWNTASMTKRVYRTTGTTGSWQLVNETGIAAATTTYSDTLTDALIAGDDMISDGWIPPPVGLTGLCVHPSGSLLGFVGNLLCASEPYQPHAWPEAYQLASGYNGVGLAVFGSTAVMATAGMPFVATGVEPASMTGEDVQGMYPCLSKRGVISIGNAVLYSSLHGLIQVGSQGVGVFTEAWYTRDEWETLNPETMECATASGRVYVSYTKDDGSRAMLIFDGSALTTVDIDVSALYADVSSGELYVSTDAGISVWDDPLETPLQGSWHSKDFVFPAPVNLGAAKIEFDLAVDPGTRTAILAAIASMAAYNAELIALLAPQIVTMTIASPGVFTVKDSLGATYPHGYVANARIVFATTGALPTGLVAGTTYFVSATSLTTNTFKVSATLGGAVINTSGSQSGVHTVMWIDADIGGAFDDDDYCDIDYSGSDLIDPPDTPSANSVSFYLYSGDQLLASRVVESTKAFRLPDGYKTDSFSVQVASQCRVKEIRVAETMEGLRGA